MIKTLFIQRYLNGISNGKGKFCLSLADDASIFTDRFLQGMCSHIQYVDKSGKSLS